MTKKWGIYIGLVFSGILLGYLFFGTIKSSENEGNTSSVNEDSLVAQSKSFGRWTCSMHPHVKGEENGTCPLCAMDLVFMEESAEEPSDFQFEMNPDALALANIETTTIGTPNSEVALIRLSGRITTNEETDAVQTTLFEGRLDELYPNFVGKRVRMGQEIGKVYSPELYLAQDKLLTSVSYRESHPKLYNAARNSLGLWKMTDQQVEEMLSSGQPMMNFPIYSDVTGTVTEVLGKEGNYYDEGTPILRVSNLNSVWAVFDVYENQVGMLREGQELEMSIAAFPGKVHTGKITFIEPIFQEERRTALMRVVLNNKNGALKPGMFVEANVQAPFDLHSDHVIVPRSSVLWTGKRSIVYKKPYDDKPIFELTEINLGHSLQNGYVVLSGLKEGDVIVTNGAFTIDAAAQLKGKPSMMSISQRVQDSVHQLHQPEIKDSKEFKTLSYDKNTFAIFLEHYFGLKDALVETDFELSKNRVEMMQVSLNGIKNDYSIDSTVWNNVEKELALMSSAENMEAMRKVFKPFSAELIDLVRKIEFSQETIYVQFCPMADNNKGALWMSLQEEIRNPYFGDKMLICGVVKEKIN